MKKLRNNLYSEKGITLISLVITIIILMILAGIAINVTVGQNGLFSRAKSGAEQYKKAQLKEELETTVIAVQTDKAGKGKNATTGDIAEELYKIATVIIVEEDYIEGEYKDREFVIDAKGNVTIGGELKGKKPDGEATLVETEEEFPTEADILVTASTSEGTIKSIEPLNGATWKTGTAGTNNVEMTFTVQENGEYRFKITGSNDRIRIVSYNMEKIVITSTDINTAISEIQNSGVSKVRVKGKVNSTSSEEPEIYSLNVIAHKGDLNLDGTTQVEGATLTDRVYEFGNQNDVAYEQEVDGTTTVQYARNTVVLKVEGNLTINENVKLTTVKSENDYGGPKGLIIYCTGTLTNNGTIDMTARGAYAKGQNVYLFKNNTTSSNPYEFVPKQGAQGALRIYNNNGKLIGGNPGNNGELRATAGGGSGATYDNIYDASAFSGYGGVGTSYSGGSGSGAAFTYSKGDKYGGDGDSDGGPGGTGNGAGWGTGNPENGTGGLLVIYANTVNNNSNILSNGSASSETTYRGGGSGGGSINIFYTQQYRNTGTINADGVDCGNGGAGGNGSVTIGSIATGTFVSN